MNVWNSTYGGIRVGDMVLAFVILLITLLVNKIFNRYITRRMMKLAAKTRHDIDDMLLKAIMPPISAVILVSGFALALRRLHFTIPGMDTGKILNQGHRVAMALIVIWVLFRLSDLLSELLRRRIARSDPDMAKQFSPLIRQSLRWTIVILGVVMIIQNLGYSVSSLLAGVGIGGLAIALAAQDTLANFFGTIVMFTDRPFLVGDWIQFGQHEGVVEEIGFRSTRIRTFANSQVVVPNKMLMAEVVENWSSMQKRRIKMSIGVTYDSKPEQIEKLVQRIRDYLKSDPEINQEFMMVDFTDFGAFSLDILLYFFTITTNWSEYLDIRQRINLDLMRMVAEEGLEFAFPSQTLYFGNEPITRQPS